MQGRLSIRDFSLVIALIAICGFFGYSAPEFLGPRNLSNLMVELSLNATLAMGMLLIILPGHIDLSVGSGLALLGGIASVLTTKVGWPAPAGLAVGLIAGILIWYAKSWLIVHERIPAFIVTLAGLLVYRGLFWLVINNETVPVVAGGQSNLYSLLSTYHLAPAAGYVMATLVALLLLISFLVTRRRQDDPEASFLKTFIGMQAVFLFVIVANQHRGIPLPAVIFGLICLATFALTQHTAMGRYLYAIGGNAEAALVSGIPVQRVVMGAFAIMGGIVAVTGFLLASYTGNSTTDLGEWMELDAVAACVIGGVSLRGGRGNVMGVLFGALIMACLINGMTLMSVSPEYKLIARGLVLLAAVWMDMRVNRS
jgi:D-xylose transport system permease protein